MLLHLGFLQKNFWEVLTKGVPMRELQLFWTNKISLWIPHRPKCIGLSHAISSYFIDRQFEKFIRLKEIDNS